jgi:3-oxoacyl-[acyl-carrier-protein] synthase III
MQGLVTRRKAAIRGIASHFPSSTLTNDQLAVEFGGDWSADKIFAKTGIATRHISGAGECSSDLGVAAARKLFDSKVCKPHDVDFLLFCTQSPDHFLPATACLMQDRLGLRTDCGAIDFNQGCSGFVYGLSLAKGLIESGSAGNVLLVTAETYSKFINPQDKSVRTLFGDAAAATLVSAVESDREIIGPFVFGTDGRGAGELIVPAGAARRPSSASTAVESQSRDGNRRSEQNLFMNGPEIYTFTLRVVPAMVKGVLEKSGLDASKVDRFIFHQANKFMLDHLRNKLAIPAEKFSLHLEHCGNTVSSTIPIALEHDRSEGLVRTGDKIMLVGFGVGLSWAATLVEIT